MCPFSKPLYLESYLVHLVWRLALWRCSAALTMGMQVPVSMRMVMAVCGSMFGFVTMAMIFVAIAVINSTIKEGMTVAMA